MSCAPKWWKWEACFTSEVFLDPITQVWPWDLIRQTMRNILQHTWSVLFRSHCIFLYKICIWFFHFQDSYWYYLLFYESLSQYFSSNSLNNIFISSVNIFVITAKKSTLAKSSCVHLFLGPLLNLIGLFVHPLRKNSYWQIFFFWISYIFLFLMCIV
jgi:hypothetical protein